MFDISAIENDNKEMMYEGLTTFVEGLLYDEKDVIANMSNLASLLYHILPDVNWAGFYLFKEGMLVLGPFGGKPACIRIQVGKGVCGKAVEERKTQCVKDVHAFEGHIACDGDTKSEIVIPIMLGDRVLGVLDIDSPILARFDEEDQHQLEKIVKKLVNACEW